MDASWLVALGIGVVLLVAFGVWLARRARGDRLVRVAPSATPRAIPLVREPTPEALAALPLPVHACPDCGYLGIRPPTLSDGAFGGGGPMTAQYCPHCGYRGPPAEFDAAADYAEYVAGLHRAWRVRKA